MDHQQEAWSLKTVIMGLYDCFIHNAALGVATDIFWGVTYTLNKGVMAFYHRLTRYADQMVRPPDRYTFKKHYVMRLSKRIFDHLVNKDVIPEYSRMETILHHARKVEQATLQMSQYWDKQ
jgi:hypothetical protein